VWIASSLDRVLKPTIAALGNFDGIHQGHQQVICPILSHHPFAQSVAPGERVYSSVITFTPHPQEFFSGESKTLLTLLPEKAALLGALGVEQLILLPFNRELANLSPQEFVADLLVQTLQVRGVSVGQDFCFGQRRSGKAMDLQQLAKQWGVDVHIAPLRLWQETDFQDTDCSALNPSLSTHEPYLTEDTPRISSSAIRQALLEGNIPFANSLLGRAYALEGQVVLGQQLGRQLGFPTANLAVSPQKFLPRQGVYAAWVEILGDDAEPSSPPVTAVLNLGHRPTVQGQEQTLEVHVLHWQGDLYHRTLRVHFQHFLRGEQRFSSLIQLQAQIQEDCEVAARLLSVPPDTGAKVDTIAAKSSLPSTAKGKW
jgi:riboflavin kinase/FMN adenylyltransferase